MASYVSEALNSLTEYIQYRKLVATPLIDIRLPSPHSEKVTRSYSSSEDVTSPSQRMLLRFRSLVEKPAFGAEKLYSAKQQLLRSASILRHKSPSFTNGINHNDKQFSQTLKTSSLDRRKDMPKLETIKDSNTNNNEDNGVASNKTVEESHAEMEGRKNEKNSNSNSSADFQDAEGKTDSSSSESGGFQVEKEKDIDRTLDADIDAEEEFEKSTESLLESSESKGIVI